MIRPFRIQVPDAVLSDLRRRLAATRWPADFANEDWRYGANVAYLRGLVRHWLEAYDWREREALMNRLPQYRTEIDGIPIHFVHLRGRGAGPPAPAPHPRLALDLLGLRQDRAAARRSRRPRGRSRRRLRPGDSGPPRVSLFDPPSPKRESTSPAPPISGQR
ncbi:MAG: hypothetical protein KatS3mg124_0158 [Porticoccaceae bacterium]|nr:MAG: hypothetical protein KatS3mg124_0158 [Porticoccaceae bacterium]